MLQWWQRSVTREVARVRRNGRAALRWSLRITIAATASYVVALVFFPGTQPLLAPLTAMLVVQVTPLSLLVTGLDRIVAVVAGVGLAVGVSAVVPLRWWSLGLLIFAAITIGQFLRLRSNLVEVAISAMLVLGVGSFGAEAAAWQRIAETLVGAAVGVLATLAFPPKVETSETGREIDGIADSLSALLLRAADELDDMATTDPGRLPGATREWLDDARRINHRIPRVGASLLQLEESRRLNVRMARSPRVEPGLRQGMEALEHSTVSVRGLMRGVAEYADAVHLGPDSAQPLQELATAFRAMAGGIDAFGELVRNEGDVQTELSSEDVARLRAALADLHEVGTRQDEDLADPGASADLTVLRATTRATLHRLLIELDLDERVRRQLRLLPPRPTRPGLKRRPPGPVPPDDETIVLPPLRDR